MRLFWRTIFGNGWRSFRGFTHGGNSVDTGCKAREKKNRLRREMAERKLNQRAAPVGHETSFAESSQSRGSGMRLEGMGKRNEVEARW